MFCLLDQAIDKEYPGKNAGDLRFFRNDQELDSEFVTVINETTRIVHQSTTGLRRHVQLQVESKQQRDCSR